ncbi:ABC transporter permease [Candidatus Nitronereus thalassa]|uniref:ABC transporter permease n=1 Tax=Candidatus Nitronereus thalassa TaxID=3020898 RepID=A0ABU3K9V4_9BACT|nr:nickel ABC transporter permease [Candidatus Nitronereus thalassa]MDT7043171.1 ABC transporter permease [Candidatus Nitronereus thalassa]
MFIQFLLSRLLTALGVILGVLCVVFLFLHLVPGDPVEVMLGESAQAADRATLRQALGLDDPLPVQLWSYLQDLAQLNLGTSLYSGRPISELLWERLPATIELGVAALLLALTLALPLGVFAAIKKETVWDFGAMGFALFGVSIPNFWMGPMLILLGALWLGWFPVSGREGFTSIVLPAITLGTAMAAILSRMVRSTLLEVLTEDFIRTARSKGLTEWAITFRHGLRNALLPVITLLGLQLGALLSGAVITETVFSWPGIGSLVVEAIHRRDYPVVQAAVLLISMTYVLVNLFTDLVYAWVDPRVRLSK